MIPMHIIEEHNEAYALWQGAVAAGLVPPGVALLHVDHHDDMACGGYSHDFSTPVTTAQQADAFVQNAAGIADFIVPALWEGWFSSLVMVKSVIPERFTYEKRYVRHLGQGVLQSGKAIPFLHARHRNAPASGYRFFDYQEGFGCPLTIKGICVLDIDMDYFCWDDSLATVPPKRMEITAEAWRQYQNDPHHPFRLFPRRLLRMTEQDGRHYLEYREYAPHKPPAGEERIVQRVERLCAWLAQCGICPAFIDICRSRFSGYCPTPQWRLVEDTLLKHLTDLYPIEIFHRRKGAEP